MFIPRKKLNDAIRKERILTKRGNNRVGVIPLASLETDFSQPQHHSMLSVGKDIVAIEKCIAECAYAGCRTIWISCPSDIEPFLRHRIGERIDDPLTIADASFLRDQKGYYNQYITDVIYSIPIYYIPYRPKIYKTQNNISKELFGPEIFETIRRIYLVCKAFSAKVTPSHFWVSFCNSIYDESRILKYREQLNKNNRFYISYEGKTIKDGLFLSFMMSMWDFSKIQNTYRELYKKYIRNDAGVGVDFSLSKFFEPLEIKEEQKVQIDWFYELDTWQKYCQYMGSEYSQKIKKRSNIRYYEYGAVGVNDDEIQNKGFPERY